MLWPVMVYVLRVGPQDGFLVCLFVWRYIPSPLSPFHGTLKQLKVVHTITHTRLLPY